MRSNCRFCPSPDDSLFELRIKLRNSGHFVRRFPFAKIQRYECRACRKGFSAATFDPCWWQKKRYKNHSIAERLCSGESQNRTARNERVNRKTVASKLIFLGECARVWLQAFLAEVVGTVKDMQFDDMLAFEATKCKPLAVAVLVESKSGFILGTSVAKIPRNGRLAAISLKKYGERVDQRARVRAQLFQNLKSAIDPRVVVRTDCEPHYARSLKRIFPECTHKTYRGRQARDHGYGELKRGGYDPLWYVNHTNAIFRCNLKCLARQSWCTTKEAERLQDRLDLATWYRNLDIWQRLQKKRAPS